MNTLCSKSNGLLSWSHYRTLLQVLDKEAREWYENEALGQTWSVRTLQRNISSQFIAEFLGYSLDDSFTETELESSIINNLQKFLMELRKRICFCCKTTTHSY